MAIRSRFLATAASGGGSSGNSLSVPIGTVISTSETLLAPQWLPCDGSVYLKATYPLLAPKLVEYPYPIRPLADQAAVVQSTASDVCVDSNTGTYVYTTGPLSANAFNAYKRTGDTLTKLPSVSPAFTVAGTRISTTADGSYAAVSHSSSPWISIVKRTAGDNFTTITPPSLTATTNMSAWSADGTYLVTASATGCNIFKRVGDTFTPLQSALLSSAVTGAVFNADASVLYVVSSSPTMPLVYFTRVGDTFTLFLPNVELSPTAVGCALSPDGKKLAVTTNTLPFFTVFDTGVDGKTFTVLENPTVAPPSGLDEVEFIDNNTVMCINTGVGFVFYKIKGSGVCYVDMDNYLKSRSTRMALFSGKASGDNNYAFVPSSTPPYLAMYKDGTTYDSATQFQVPLEVQVDARLNTYIRAS